MWHASASAISVSVPGRHLRRATEKALLGVGDPELGEWTEDSDIAYHLRRRLTPQEELLVGKVVDCRGTREAQRRFALMEPYMPPVARAIGEREVEAAGAGK